MRSNASIYLPLSQPPDTLPCNLMPVFMANDCFLGGTERLLADPYTDLHEDRSLSKPV